ncbi:MAG: phosphatidate cytidylyltransferase [Ignavibacteriales bacterium]|jgi:phosphatidate cytidylyltransferase|nr:MAG: phosphatidate cytidylyltransferase [Ignavibacteriales bacterium]
MSGNKTGTRIIVSVAAIPFIGLAAYFGGLLFLIFVLGIALISFFEFSILVKSKGTNPNLIFGLTSVVLILLNVYFEWLDFYILILLISFILLIVELYRDNNSAILNLGSTFLGIFYIGVFSASLLSIRELFNFSNQLYEQGGLLIIALFVTIWICDSAAFFLGTAFGKHKLFPRVSPKKSWEGAIAGFIFSILTMIAAHFILLDFLSLVDSFIIGTIVGTVGQIGDLIESLIKRDANVKDSSALIPGHGGVFDRFDSLLFSAPAVYVYLIYTMQL